MRNAPHRPLIAIFFGLLLVAGCGSEEVSHAQEGERAGPPEVARPYDESADANAEIEAALERARAGNKRVLLVFGANWCPWCRRLEHVLRNDPTVQRELREGYELVHVDVGPRRSSRNREINQRYGDPMQNGLPVLVVLDAQGERIHTQETGSLEEGDHHDPARVAAFLRSRRAGG